MSEKMERIHLPLAICLLVLSNYSYSLGGAIRIKCGLEGDGAKLYLSEKYIGDCPLTKTIQEQGQYVLKAVLPAEGDYQERVFEKNIVADGGVQKVVLRFPEAQLSQAAQDEQRAAELAEQKKIEEQQRKIREEQERVALEAKKKKRTEELNSAVTNLQNAFNSQGVVAGHSSSFKMHYSGYFYMLKNFRITSLDQNSCNLSIEYIATYYKRKYGGFPMRWKADGEYQSKVKTVLDLKRSDLKVWGEERHSDGDRDFSTIRIAYINTTRNNEHDFPDGPTDSGWALSTRFYVKTQEVVDALNAIKKTCVM